MVSTAPRPRVDGGFEEAQSRRVRSLAAVEALLAEQHGVISRKQCLAAGISRSTVASLVKGGRWQRLHQGVYVAHSGPIGDDSRIRGAVLAVPGSMVCNETVLWMPKRRGPLVVPIHLAVDADKPPRPRAGIKLHLVRTCESLGSDPPRMSYERALLGVVDGMETAAAVEQAVCQVVGDRLTVPARVQRELAQWPRHRWRSLLTQILEEVAVGARSPLELLDLRNDQRHGLPSGKRQVHHRAGGLGRWLDVVVQPPERPDLVVVKELDGRLGHESTGRFRDMLRDNVASISGGHPVRFGWADQYGAPCETAAWQVLLWRRLGLEVGAPCGTSTCELAARVDRLAQAHPPLSA